MKCYLYLSEFGGLWSMYSDVNALRLDCMLNGFATCIWDCMVDYVDLL